MRVDVVATVAESNSQDFMFKTVIVIDVLRTSSSIITALSHGCTAIIPVESVCQAKSLQQELALQEQVMLGGERSCRPLPGFDFGNSPKDFMDPSVEGRKLIMTTPNGTRAILKAGKAANLLIGALLNAEQCARTAIELKKDIILLCAGNYDVFALEDGLCAGLLLAEMMNLSENKIEVNDFGRAMYTAYKHMSPCLTDALLASSYGRRLVKHGYTEDVHFCAQINSCSLVPVMKHAVLLPFVF